MTKSVWMKSSFNGGELSPLIDGRTDYPKYQSGAKLMRNWIPTVYGPMTKRPGTHFTTSLGTDKPFFLPFEFNDTQSYVLCFTENKLRMFTGSGIMDTGDGSTVFELETDYLEDELAFLKIAQSGDVAYITHPDHPVMKLSRIGSNEFTLEEAVFKNGPFDDDNLDEDITMTVTGLSNNIGDTVTITSSSDTFVGDGWEGRLIKISYIPETEMDTWEAESHNYAGTSITYSSGDYLTYLNNVYKVTNSGETGTRSPLHTVGTVSDGKLNLQFVGTSYGYAKVTSKTSDTVVVAEIVRALPIGYVTSGGTKSTDFWSLGSFSKVGGYPSTVTFHQQRLVFAGTASNPQTIYGSTLDDIEDFERTSEADASEGYTFTLAAEKRNLISWMKSTTSLNIGTTGSEFIVSSSGSTITPTDISVKKASTYGSRQTVDAILSNGYILFAQSGGKKLRQITYDYNTDRFYALDLNKVADHLTRDGITQMAVQGEPYQLIWCVVDGMLRCLTYETEENVFAWHQHDLSGAVDGDGYVSTVCSIPTDDKDRLWIACQRGGNWYVEYLEEYYNRDIALEDAFFLDSGLAYSGEPTMELTGLDHLEGYSVCTLNNGAVEPNKTVVDGKIALDNETTKAIVGLCYDSPYVSMRLSGGSQEGIAQGKSKHLKNVIFRLEATGSGLYYGLAKITAGQPVEAFNLALLPTRLGDGYMDFPPDLAFGDTEKLAVPGGNSSEWMFMLNHKLPTPCTIISIISQLDTDEG